MTAMQATSLEAFESIRDSLPERQAEVFAWLRMIQPACSLEISDFSGIPPNVVTPRMLELRKAGLVVESHRAKCRTGRTAIYWRLAESEPARAFRQAAGTPKPRARRDGDDD
jgi:predicted ArsR family transcriptional regulator